MKGTLQDFYINIIFFVATWIIAGKTPKRKLFALRAALCFVAFCVIRYLVFKVLIGMLPPEARRWLRMLGFVLLMGMVSGAAAVCYKCDAWTAIFFGSTGYLAQNICQRVYTIASWLIFKKSEDILHSLVMIAVAGALLTLLYFIMRKIRLDKVFVDNRYILAISLLIIATSIVLDLFAQGNVSDTRIMRYYIYISSAVVSSLIFVLLISLSSGRRTQIERDTIKSMLKEEREQYYFEKAMIDRVNIACHDLKHQISSANGQLSEELKKDVREVVDSYDSTFSTGNPALDVVLTRKNFRCKESNIELTCAVNGKELDFMSEVDVYSLFGNILDNAIEAVEKLEQGDKRVVTLSLDKKDYFVYIHAENYFAGKLSYSGGLPRTTKSDGGLHGYGMKSIRMLVDKYGGSTKIDTKEDRFMLDIMIPV